MILLILCIILTNIIAEKNYRCNDFANNANVSHFSAYVVDYEISSDEHKKRVLEQYMHMRIKKICKSKKLSFGKFMKYLEKFTSKKEPEFPKFVCTEKLIPYTISDAKRACISIFEDEERWDREWIYQEIQIFSTFFMCHRIREYLEIKTSQIKNSPEECEQSYSHNSCLAYHQERFEKWNIENFMIWGIVRLYCMLPDENEYYAKYNNGDENIDNLETQEARSRKMKFLENKRQIYFDQLEFQKANKFLNSNKFYRVSSIFAKSVIEADKSIDDHRFMYSIPCKIFGQVRYNKSANQLLTVLPCEAFDALKKSEMFLRGIFSPREYPKIRSVQTVKIVGAKLKRAPLILYSHNYYLYRNIKHLDLSLNSIVDFTFLKQLPNLKELSIGKQSINDDLLDAPLDVLIDMKHSLRVLNIEGLKVNPIKLAIYLTDNHTIELLNANCDIFENKKIIDQICYGASKKAQIYCFDERSANNPTLDVRKNKNPCIGVLGLVLEVLKEFMGVFILMFLLFLMVCVAKRILSCLNKNKATFPINEMRFDLSKRLELSGFSDKEEIRASKIYNGYPEYLISREIIGHKKLFEELCQLLRYHERFLSNANDEQIVAYALAQQFDLNRKLLKKSSFCFCLKSKKRHSRFDQ